jgi:hypothetical protein
LPSPENTLFCSILHSHARAIEVTGKEKLQHLAKAMGSKFVTKANGAGEIWIGGHKPAADYSESLKALGQDIAAGWKTKMDNQAKTEADDASSNT